VGPLVVPGTYEVRLTAGGQTVSQRLVVRNDPRVSVSQADLEALSSTERSLAAGIETSAAAVEQVRGARKAAADRAGVKDAPPAVKEAVVAFDRAAVATVVALAGNRGLASELSALEFADMRPTESTQAAVRARCARADESLGRYRAFVDGDLAALNRALTAAGVAAIPVPKADAVPVRACGM